MRTTLSLSIDEDLDAALRAEAERQRRPLSWVACEAIRKGLPKHTGNGATKRTASTVAQGDRT